MEYVHHKGMVCPHRPEPFLTKHSLTAYTVSKKVTRYLYCVYFSS